MSEGGDRNPPRGEAGCLAAAALFVVVFIAIWLAAVTLFGLVVEQWALIRVRREFSYDWAFVYAPLLGTGFGAAAAFFLAKRVSAARMTLLIVVAGLVALCGGILLLGLGGLI